MRHATLAARLAAAGALLGLVSEETFLSILNRAAAEAGVTFQVFAVTGAAADHPVAAHFPEGRYLKAVFARVTPTVRAGGAPTPEPPPSRD